MSSLHAAALSVADVRCTAPWQWRAVDRPGAVAAGWIAVSIALHAAVLFAIPKGAMGWANGWSMPALPLEARLVVAAPAVDSPLLDVKSAAIERSLALAERPLEHPIAKSEPRFDAISPPNAESSTAEFDEGLFMPSSLVAVRPTPIGNIAVPYPDDTEQQPRTVTSEVTLFIDETGTVVRVKADETALPRAFQQAAMNAFVHGRFKPGIMDDQPVKTRMRVEITFENRATASR